MSHYQRAGLVFQQNLVFLEMCKGLIDGIISVFDFCLVIWFLFKWANQSLLVTVIVFNTSYFISPWNKYHPLAAAVSKTHTPQMISNIIYWEDFFYLQVGLLSPNHSLSTEKLFNEEIHLNCQLCVSVFPADLKTQQLENFDFLEISLIEERIEKSLLVIQYS